MRIVTLLRHQAVLQIIDLIKSYIFLLIFLLKQHTGMVHYELHRNTHGIPLVISTSRFFPHAWLITEFVTRVAWQVPLMEQKLLTLLDHLSSPLVFSRARVAQSLVFCVALCRSLSVRFSFCLLATVLSVFLQFTDSDYPFSIFKLFLEDMNSIIWEGAHIFIYVDQVYFLIYSITWISKCSASFWNFGYFCYKWSHENE